MKHTKYLTFNFYLLFCYQLLKLNSKNSSFYNIFDLFLYHKTPSMMTLQVFTQVISYNFP